MQYNVDPKLFDLDDDRIFLLESKRIDEQEFLKRLKPEDPILVNVDTKNDRTYINAMTKTQININKKRYLEQAIRMIVRTGNIEDRLIVFEKKGIILKVFPELEKEYEKAEKLINAANCTSCEKDRTALDIIDKMYEIGGKDRELRHLIPFLPELAIRKLEGHKITAEGIPIKMPKAIDKVEIPFKKAIREKEQALQKGKQKLIIRNHQSPGDGVTLAFAIEALHRQYPDQFITDVRVPYRDLFQGNPHISELTDDDEYAMVIEPEYETIHSSNEYAYHFITGFMEGLSKLLDLPIKPVEWNRCVYIT